MPYGFGPSNANSDSCRTYSSGNESELPLLDKLYQHDNRRDSSVAASMEKRNLREELKSIDNPIFEVNWAKVNYVAFFNYDFILEQKKQSVFIIMSYR